MRVFIHTPYLVNLGSPTPSTYERSVASVAHNLGGPSRSAPRASSCTPAPASTTGTPATPRCARCARACCRCSTRLGDGRALAAARADRRPGPLAVRRGRRPRALPRRARPPPARSASAWTPATCSPPAPRSTSPAAPPPPSTGSSRSAAPGRLRLVHANDSMDVRGAFKDRHQKHRRGPHRRRRLRGAVRAPGHRRACRSCWRRPAPATPATRRSPLLQEAARDGEHACPRAAVRTLLATARAARR